MVSQYVTPLATPELLDIYITQGQAKSNRRIVKNSDSETFQSVSVPSKRRGRFVADESRSRQAPVRPQRLR